jgi:hypothetical protein
MMIFNFNLNFGKTSFLELKLNTEYGHRRFNFSHLARVLDRKYMYKQYKQNE